MPVILAAAVCCVGVFMSGGTGQSRNTVLQKAGLSADARAAILTVGDDVGKLDKSHENYVKAAGELDSLYIKLLQKAREVSRLAVEAQKARGQALDKLFKATGEMQEMSQSFNLQYLGLQQTYARREQAVHLGQQHHEDQARHGQERDQQHPLTAV